MALPVTLAQPAGPLMSVGVARADVTPAEPIRLTGYGNRTKPADVIGAKLWAKALAVAAGPEAPPSVLITVDLIGVSSAITEEVAARLRRAANLAREDVVIAATHTHNGPALTGVLPFIFSPPATDEERAAIDRYTRQLVDRLEAVAREAIAARTPARLAWGQGRAGFAANRRMLKDGRWIGFGIEPGGPVDSDVPVLAAHDAGGKLIAVLAGYACHATTLEGRDNFVHGDWPGAAQAAIEARHPGVTALVTIGTGADANPNPRGGGLAHVEAHGRAIADAVDAALAGAMTPLTARPVGRFRSVDLDLAPIPDASEWESRARQPGAAGLYARAVLDGLRAGRPPAATAAYPVQTWVWPGALTMVFLGGEVVADYGLRLKRELGGPAWVTAYANDVPFYVPSRRMIPEGGYEVVGSMVYYGQPAPLAEGTEDRIIAAAIASATSAMNATNARE